MSIEDCIAQAKLEIFGVPATDVTAVSALNFAKNYFDPLIIEAELVLQKMCMATQNLKICLMKAFDVYKHKCLQPYGKYLSIIEECARRFERRYGILVGAASKAA